MGVGPLLVRCGARGRGARDPGCPASAAYPPAVASHPVSDPRGRGRRSAMTEHDQLPLPDYDHIPVEGLASRIRMLDAQGLETLLEYERAHADRLRVVTIMENRLAALREGAQPSGGDPAAAAADDPVAATNGSKVSDATTGPVISPPSQGDPTNPAQPRSTG